MAKMNVEKLPIEGGQLITLKSFTDGRGRYVETWNERDYEQYLPKEETFRQDDYSQSYQGVLRGLHGDYETWKLIQCVYGTLNFVMFDTNTHQTYEIVLTDSNPQQILVPPQCANGHLCLSPTCIFYYKQTTLYGETKQFTIKWNDPQVKAKWSGIKNPTLSERDLEGPFLDFGDRR